MFAVVLWRWIRLWQKSIFKRQGLPVIDDYIVAADADLNATAGEIERLLGPNVVIKPLNQGSALGCAVVTQWWRYNGCFGTVFSFWIMSSGTVYTWPRGHCRHPRNTKWQQSPPCN